MEVQIVKWGNGQGVRIPKGIMKEMGLQCGEHLALLYEDGRIILQKRSFKHKTLEERAMEHGGKLGPYKEFDWGVPTGREVW